MSANPESSPATTEPRDREEEAPLQSPVKPLLWLLLLLAVAIAAGALRG